MPRRTSIRTRTRTHTRLVAHLLLGAACASLLASRATAQVTEKPDGEWRSLITAGASVASGNTHASSLAAGADVVRLTPEDKWSILASGQYARNDGERTAKRAAGTGVYSRNVGPGWFGFGQLDLMYDAPANISSRTTLGGGLGYHVSRNDNGYWDVAGGLAYTWDRYIDPAVIDGRLRSDAAHPDLLLSEESSHKLTDSTSLKQKLTVYPALGDAQGVRTVFDAGISVAMTRQLSLTATLSQRYDSAPAQGFGKSDTLFVTGLSLRFD